MVRDNDANLYQLVMPHKTLEHFARLLLQANIVPESIADSPTYKDIIKSFKATLPFLKAVEDIEKHCQKFIASVEKVGGDGAIACSRILSEGWMTTAKNIGYSDFMSKGECHLKYKLMVRYLEHLF